jgi:hypothetical protein
MFQDKLLFVLFGLVFFLFYPPLSFAEFCGIGRVNSPGMANLALCARTAHQGGLVGNTRELRHPECFFRGKRIRRHSFGYFSFAVERKVTRQRGETRNA